MNLLEIMRRYHRTFIIITINYIDYRSSHKRMSDTQTCMAVKVSMSQSV